MKTEPMKDLQGQIREKAKAYSDSVIVDEFNPLRKYNIHDLIEEMECAFEQGANFILSKWQESEKWRKVEEELPKNQDIVLVKTDNGCYMTAYLHGKESGFITYGEEAYHSVGEITHWRPLIRRI